MWTKRGLWVSGASLLMMMALCGCESSSKPKQPVLQAPPQEEVRVQETVVNGHFTIMNESLTDKRLEILLGRAEGQEIRVMELPGNLLTAKGMQVLVASKDVGSVTELVLNNNALKDEGLEVLAKASFLPGLRSLQVSRVKAGEAGAKALGAVPFQGLALLSANQNAWGDEGARALANLRGVKALHVQDCGIGALGARSLLSASSAEELDLSKNTLGAGALVGLEKVSGNLKTLRLAKTGLSVEDMRVLSKMDLAGLEVLNLKNNEGLTDEALALLGGAPWLSGLRVLNVTGNPNSASARRSLQRVWGERKGLSIQTTDL